MKHLCVVIESSERGVITSASLSAFGSIVELVEYVEENAHEGISSSIRPL